MSQHAEISQRKTTTASEKGKLIKNRLHSGNQGLWGWGNKRVSVYEYTLATDR